MLNCRRVFYTFAFALPIFAGGCSIRTIPEVKSLTGKLSGKVHGGQQPVSGATIQLFDATTGATPLLSSTVLTDQDGNFTITGQYSCPASSDQVYLAATGGDPGAGVNESLVLMTALGDCGSLGAATIVAINEITTVATIFAYAPFFTYTPATPGANIAGGDSNALANFLSLTDPANGSSLATNGADIQLKMNSLADSLATCINAPSAGGVNQQCNTLIGDAAPSVPANLVYDSASAIYLVATNPTYMVTSVYQFSGATPPFQPTLASAPADWNMNLH